MTVKNIAQDGYYVTLDAVYRVTFSPRNETHVTIKIKDHIWKNDHSSHSSMLYVHRDGYIFPAHNSMVCLTLEQVIDTLQERFVTHGEWLRREADKFITNAAYYKSVDAEKLLRPQTQSKTKANPKVEPPETYVSPFTGKVT